MLLLLSVFRDRHTHHCHVVEHAAVNPRLIKLGFILRQADIIQPSWQRDSPSDTKQDLQVQQSVANMLLTHHPVVVQLSLVVLFL